MGRVFSKETFEVDKSTKFSSQSEGFYRTFDQLNHWNSQKNGKPAAAAEASAADNGALQENRSVASTAQIAEQSSESSSIAEDEEATKSPEMKTISE